MSDLEVSMMKRVGELNAEVNLLKAEVDAYKPASDEVAAAFLALPAPHNQVGRVIEGIESLKAEVERLKEGNEYLGQMHDKEMERSAYLLEEFNRTTAWGRGLESDLSHARVEISFLKAEVDRLRKAGDAMADELIQEYGREVCLKFGWFKGWNAAKEGKPSV